MNDNCEYWRAQWDGQLCHLLSSDYQHVSTTGTILYEITTLTFPRIVNPLLEPSTGWTAPRDQSLAMQLWRMIVSMRAIELVMSYVILATLTAVF